MRNNLPKILFFTALFVVLLLVIKRTKAMELDSGEIEVFGSDGYSYRPQNTVPTSDNFSMSEFACNCGAQVPADYWGNLQLLMDNLEVIRAHFGGKPITINSGYRTPAYNKKVGGVSSSQHLTGSAADFKVSGVSPNKVHSACVLLRSQGKLKNGGIGKYFTFTHFDIRNGKADWDKTK